MARVLLTKLNKKYDEKTHAVKDVNLEIRDREFVVLVGPSGCGKTTTLRMVAGLEDITSGEIRIDERVVNDLPPMDRDIAMVFQNYALYPHMSVFANLSFALRLRTMPGPLARLMYPRRARQAWEEIRRRVHRAADVLDIRHLLERK